MLSVVAIAGVAVCTLGFSAASNVPEGPHPASLAGLFMQEHSVGPAGLFMFE
jgi:hypothetical protein